MFCVTQEFEMVVFWKEWLDKVQLFEQTDISKVVYIQVENIKMAMNGYCFASSV